MKYKKSFLLYEQISQIFKILLLIFISGFGIIGLNYKIISLSTHNLIYYDVDKLPYFDVVLVPGAGDSINNKTFKGRMNAVAEIYNARKITKIIASGRNDLPGYDEPGDMETALIIRGIDRNIISKDYAGKRTFKSIVKAKAVLKKDSVIIVSQKAHLERALFIAKAEGLRAVGYVARENYYVPFRRYGTIYESLARLKCDVDCLKILFTDE
ncbi:MAG: ElyC/SanA/YdcF family protein [Bacteroidia bacterium]